MALITQNFTVTITDENDPTTVQEIDFTDDAYQSYSVTSTSMPPFVSATYPTWNMQPTTLLFDVSTIPTILQTGYIVIRTDNPIYVWIGRDAARTVAGAIDETVTPKIVTSRCLILSGGVTKVYAVNPSADNSTPPLTAHVRTTIAY